MPHGASPIRRRDALLARADARFEATCLNTTTTERTHCKAMRQTLTSYAAFHNRVFDEATPCAERRVLIVRESFSDIVGVGHAHMGLQRFLALGLALGRAVVFSACTSRDDPWLVKGRALWKNAAAYSCDEPHLSMGDHYVGFGGIDLRWSPERQKVLRSCGYSEMALDLNNRALPQMAGEKNPHSAFMGCKNKWNGCTNGWNHDQMGCDFRARAGCPDTARLFGPNRTLRPRLRPRLRPQQKAGGRRLAQQISLPISLPSTDPLASPAHEDARGGRGRGTLGPKAGLAPIGWLTPKGGLGPKGGLRPKGVLGPKGGLGAMGSLGAKDALFTKNTKPRARPTASRRRSGPDPNAVPPAPLDVEAYARAPILGLYNARRDGGAYGLPSWQLAVGNGAASVGAPNGSSVGIASEADLRDTLTCPYSCWAHANFQPASLLRKLLERASRKLSPTAPLTCAHLRTMWVDDHRCAPNPRGCHLVEFRRLVYWNTSLSIMHGTGRHALPTGSARSALDGSPYHFSSTEGRLSPLWWHFEVQRPLPFCRVHIRTAPGVWRASVRAGRIRRRAERQQQRVGDGGDASAAANTTSVREAPRRLRVSIVAADGKTVVWTGLTTPLDVITEGQGYPGQTFDVRLPTPATGKWVRIEMAFDERNAPARMSLQVDAYTDEELTWPNIDRFVAVGPTAVDTDLCKLVAWRGTCPGTFHKTMLPLLGGWSGFVNCAAHSRKFRNGLLKSQGDGPRDAFRFPRTVEGLGRRLQPAVPATPAGDASPAPPPLDAYEGELPPVYFSTDSPAVQQLALETFPRRLVTIEGEPVPSWARNKSSADYAKVLADFEMLKLCDVIVGPVSSNYAKTAAVESLVSRGYLSQQGMCNFDQEQSQAKNAATPSLKFFEKKRGVEGMFSECASLGESKVV